MSFLFVNKPLWLNNLKTRPAINAKISLFVICVEAIYICYYLICMMVPLKIETRASKFHFLLFKLKTQIKTFLNSILNETKLETRSCLLYTTLVTKPFCWSQDERTQTSWKKTRRKNSTKIKKFMYKHKSIFFQMLLLTRDLEGRFGSHICSYFFGTATFSGKLLLKSNKHFLLFRSSYYLRVTTF